MSLKQSLILAREFMQLRQNFDRYFEVMPATTPALREAAFNVRHRVYCEDLGWEPVRADRMETDEWDANALHLVLRSRELNEFVGCVRLLRVPPQAPETLLPFEQACQETLDHRTLELLDIPRMGMAEVSRLAVDGRYRRRAHERNRPAAISDDDYGKFTRPRFPYIPVGLYLALLEAARLHGIDTLFMLTEPWLAAHFRKLGVRLEPVGGPIEHRGERVPSMMSVSLTIRQLHMFVKPLFRGIAEDVRLAYGAPQAARELTAA